MILTHLIDTDVIAHISERPNADVILRGLELQIDAGQLKTVEQVLDELRRWPELQNRFNARKADFLIRRQYRPAIAAVAGQISDDFEFLYDLSGTRNPDPADPWLIAAAKVLGFAVVTDERQVSTKKIPYVCRQQSLLVPCISGATYLEQCGIH